MSDDFQEKFYKCQLGLRDLRAVIAEQDKEIKALKAKQVRLHPVEMPDGEGGFWVNLESIDNKATNHNLAISKKEGFAIYTKEEVKIWADRLIGFIPLQELSVHFRKISDLPTEIEEKP